MEKNLLKSYFNYFVIAILSVVLYSCSTQKDKFLNRSYHKATSKFNGYFNGKVSLKEAVTKLEKTYQDSCQEVNNEGKRPKVLSKTVPEAHLEAQRPRGTLSIQQGS